MCLELDMHIDDTHQPGPGPPQPAPAPAGQGGPERPDPAADLRPGGFLDQVLEESKARARGEAGTLHEELATDLHTMRQAMASPKYYLTRYLDLPAEAVPGWLVRHQTDQYRIDAVLRFCVGRRWRVEDEGGKLRAAALKHYQMRPDAYDQVLGDLLPEDFRQQGRAALAEARFEEGANDTAAEDWPVYRARLRRRRGRPLLGIPTGLPALDRALGGLRGLTYLGGGTGAGKTSLGLFIAMHALRARQDLGVLFYSLDMPKVTLYDRLLSQEAGVEYADLLGEAADPGLEGRLDEAERRLQTEVLPRLRVAEYLAVPEGKWLAQVMVDDLVRLLESMPVEEVLVVVDYFQLLPVPDSITAALDADFYRVRSLQRVQAWSRTNTNPLGFPILAISEVRKGESGRSEVGVGDLMGSARLGYSAEAVLLLEPAGQADKGPVVPVRLKVAKGRDGATRTDIDLLFEYTRSRFREAPQPRGPKGGGKAKKGGPAQKSDAAKTDPLAGLEG
jgi:replicative DNA helicase